MSVFGICPEFVKNSGQHTRFLIEVLYCFLQDNPLRVAIDLPETRILDQYEEVAAGNPDLQRWLIHLGRNADISIEGIEMEVLDLADRELMVEVSSKIIPDACLIAWSNHHYSKNERDGLEIIDRIEAASRVKKVTQGARRAKTKKQQKGTGISIGNVGEMYMGTGDTYKAKQAGAMGPGAQVNESTFIQNAGNEIEINFSQLAPQLNTLRLAMKENATDADHDVAIAEVAKAEQAAKKSDKATVLEHLKAAGNWAAEIATKIGVSVASKAIESAMGIK
jgi:hypothetical protein